MSESLILSPDELRHLTGYKLAKAQLRVLREMGCWMARQTPFGVSCPRAHFEAVCKGAVPGAETPPAAPVPQVKTLAMRQAQRAGSINSASRART